MDNATTGYNDSNRQQMVRPLRFGPDGYESQDFLGFQREIVHQSIAESAVINGRCCQEGKEKPAYAGFENSILMLRYTNLCFGVEY